MMVNDWLIIVNAMVVTQLPWLIMSPGQVYRCDASALPRLPFWFPITVPLGVITADGTYLVNPEKSQLGGYRAFSDAKHRSLGGR